MTEITSMTITSLTLENFRNHTEPREYTFGDISTVSGHNGVGKTTMAHAVCYALYGVSYFGEQKIERLMNEKADSAKVKLDFVDGNGQPHSVVRSRWRDKTSLMFDGYTVQQAAIDGMFGDKDTFLAIFNPTYLAECMKNNGRELILKYIPEIKKEDVLDQIPDSRSYLDSLPLESESAQELLRQTREGIRRAEQQSGVLEGHLESYTQSKNEAARKLEELYPEKKELETEIERLKAKQFEGVDAEDASIRRDLLAKQLNSGEEDTRLSDLREKLSEAKGRTYISKISKPFAESQAEYNAIVEQYKKTNARLNEVKVGDVCPVCKMAVTEENISEYKENLSAECSALADKGRGLKERLKDLAELDRKAKEQFEEYRADDIAKYTAEIESYKSDSVDKQSILAEIDRLDALEKYGNLSEEEYARLVELQTDLIGVEAQIKATQETVDKERLTALLNEKDSFEKQIEEGGKTVSALTEYIFKHAELASEKLVMPNVKIHLFDVARTTGEVRNTFKFYYKGREYSSLSLSEKTLAGMEISAMLRKLTGKDYPVCIDNTESIASFGNAELPKQVWLLRVVKGQPLTVTSQNRGNMSKAA